MKKLFILALLTAFAAQGQINDEGTGVQVIAYFDKGEKYTYDLTYDKARINGTDTTYTLRTSYKVDVTVLDSTANGYTMQWKYRDYKADKADELTQKLVTASEGLVVKFRTDELGVFQELLNWEDIRDYNRKAFDIAFKSTLGKELLEKIHKKFSTREAIEGLMIKDILLFHSLHGIAVDADEVIQEEIEEESTLGGKPIKSSILLELDEIDVENSDFVVRFYQSFHKDTINNLMTAVLEDFDGINFDGNMETTSMEDYVGAQIHETGWPINVYYQRVIDIKNRQGLEMRTITME